MIIESSLGINKFEKEVPLSKRSPFLLDWTDEMRLNGYIIMIYDSPAVGEI